MAGLVEVANVNEQLDEQLDNDPELLMVTVFPTLSVTRTGYPAGAAVVVAPVPPNTTQPVVFVAHPGGKSQPRKHKLQSCVCPVASHV